MWNPSLDVNTVLLVDDDPAMLLMLGRYLRLHGFNLLTAGNGVEALRIMGEHGPRIVLTDWEMPEMDGLTLCRKIRSFEGIGFTYVILLTAHSDSEHVVGGFEAGADDYMIKPFNKRELLGRIAVAQRVIQIEASCREDTIHARKINAKMGAMNATLQRMARLLDESRNTAEATTKAKSEFLANMSHEIRTPLTAILGFTDLLMDGTLPESERHDAIRTIRRNGEHLHSVIDDILDLSRIEAGQLMVERVRTSPLEIVAKVQSLLDARASDRNITLRTEYVGAIPETIETDPIRLSQILINLVGNAIKFTEKGMVRLVGRLVLPDASPVSGDSHAIMQFDVIDTGIGMTKEQVGKVFQAFVQGAPSTTRKYGGSGLGLLISKQLATMLGGNIGIVSSEPGQGSHFRATVSAGSLANVRMIENPAKATMTVQNPETQTNEEAPLEIRILLAEDGLDNRKLVSHILRRVGAEVTLAENGRVAAGQALKAAKQGRPFDVVLMDMQMPVMDGYAATHLLRQKGYTAPIIALTAHAMATDRAKCLRIGCNDYVSKPINRKTLIETIRNQVSVHQAAQTPVAIST